MTANRNASAGNDSDPLRSKLRWGGVLFALTLPTFITWAYFVVAGRYSTNVQQVTYLVVKSIQFAFPLLWVWLALREPLRIGRPSMRGLALGAAFSVVVVGAGWLVFDRVLRGSPVFASVPPLVRAKIDGFGINSTWKFAALAGFYSLFHSLLEEYYWRWFVFRQLRQLMRLWPAVVVSALGFMGHHVIVLGEFFKETPWVAWLLSSAVATGGVFWAWLYERTGSLFGPWLSHLLIDAGIFWIGYELLHSAMNAGG